MDYGTAVSVAAQGGFNVGFVLTKDDPYFLLDLDDVRNAATGEWDSWSQQVAALFPGAAMEVSYSQTGMHIYGRCDAERLRTKKRKFADNKGEFYTEGRFVALGHGAQGDVEIDWTNQLDGLIPTRDIADLEANYDGPVPEYTGGNWSDEELIQKMISTAGSMAAQFGDKLHPRDLWLGDVAKLATHFPSQSGDLYDRSSADASLMSHLAFWTGKDYQRMDKLFRMSALMREKFEKRPDYRQNTITGAIGGCRSVYSVPQISADKQQAKAEKMAAELQSGELLTVQEQMEKFKGCVYVASHNAILTPTGAMLTSPQFRVAYGGHKFLMSQDGTDPTKNAWEAFTENRVARYPWADRLTFRPDLDFQDIVTDADGKKAVNYFRRRDVRRVKGDVKPFMRLLCKMIPDERDRQIILSYMAGVCQYPGRKFLWAPVVQGAQGNGKSTLISVLQYCVDGVVQGVNDDESMYVTTMTAKDIDDKFNGNMANKTLCVIHEMHTDSFKDQRERQDHLKTLVTEPTMMIEEKGVNKYQARNVVNFFFCSNHRDAVRLEDNERRFAVFYTAQQTVADILAQGMTPQWFQDLWGWLRADGFAVIYDYLMDYDIPAEFNPAGGATRAPVTSSTAAAVAESRSPVETILHDAIMSEEQGFKNGWVSTRAVANLCEADGIKKPATRSLSTALRAMGYFKVGKVKVVMQEGGMTNLWSTTDRGDKVWASVPEIDQYLGDQMYPKTPSIG